MAQSSFPRHKKQPHRQPKPTTQIHLPQSPQGLFQILALERPTPRRALKPPRPGTANTAAEPLRPLTLGAPAPLPAPEASSPPAPTPGPRRSRRFTVLQPQRIHLLATPSNLAQRTEAAPRPRTSHPGTANTAAEPLRPLTLGAPAPLPARGAPSQQAPTPGPRRSRRFTVLQPQRAHLLETPSNLAQRTEAAPRPRTSHPGTANTPTVCICFLASYPDFRHPPTPR